MAYSLYGRIIDRDPIIRASIASSGEMVLGRGRLPLVVDTGFSGDLALPRSVLRRLRLEYMGATPYTLADGALKVFNDWAGTVVLDHGRSSVRRVKAIFTEGDGLLGMDFMMENYQGLEMDFDQRIFHFAPRR